MVRVRSNPVPSLFCLLLMLLVVYLLGILFSLVYSHVNSDCYSSISRGVRAKKVTDPVHVLTWEANSHWAGWGDFPNYNWAGYEIEKPHCEVDCRFHGDQSLASSADLILFEPQPFGRRNSKWPLIKKPCGQKWGMFTYETSAYFPVTSKWWYAGRMDWKINYEKDADVQVSLTCDWGHPIEKYLAQPLFPKSSFAVFVASNCRSGGASKRTAYVKELMNYIKVDSYGLCLQNMPQDEFNRNTAYDRYNRKMSVYQNYKFVLAFENNNFTDYVTEKLSHALLSGSVPVYMGAPNVLDWVPGDHSIIKTDDFKNPRELASYLQYLDSNDTAYMEYFKWKEKGLSESFKKTLENCVFYAECRVCKKIVDERSRNFTHEFQFKTTDPTYYEFQIFWNLCILLAGIIIVFIKSILRLFSCLVKKLPQNVNNRTQI